MKRTKQLNLIIATMMVFTLFFAIPAISLADSAPAHTIDIVEFNDFHGNVAEDVNSWGKNIGMAKMVGEINDLKAKNPNTVVISGGDNYQGTAISNLTYGKPVNEMMKAVGTTASAVGNHEFDWGQDYLSKWSKEGNFDYLASNIYVTSTGKPVEWAKPYKIIEVDGVKIGLIGLAHPDTLTLTKAENVTGLEFRDPVKAAQEWIDFLKAGKAAEGTPDVIIAVTHLDSAQNYDTKEITGSAVTLANGVTGLDGIISAHSHKTVYGKVNGVAIVQAYKYGRALGHLTITLDANNKLLNVEPTVDAVYKVKNDIIPDPSTEKVLATYEENFAPILKEVVGKTTATFTNNRKDDNVTPLGQWVCEVMANKVGVQVGIQNGGGLRRDMYAGDITMGDMYEIMPFDNALVTMDLPGKDLRAAIEHGISNPDVSNGSFSGLLVTYDPAKEFGQRIVSIKLADGTPLDDNKNYSVVVNDFMFGGGDKYDFSNATNVVNTYVPIRDVLVEAAKKGTLTPKAVTEIKALPTYTVVSNDMLWKIAKKYGVTYKAIGEYNGLKNVNYIIPGQQLVIPVQ
ncbi:5'-nucleotidase C-terminal domain-containing protein [Helicovermis profundi]|uniref:5'-nucleotidase C-terminal domain-containing protein n=1 Tax=Helicovermis profundi TaxID=3065157 RepID=A0AAU9EVR3_9FIRM|nr:5'-nucleotidase C-terminal domain-containing protein [Clostridia bacterium S502]